MSTACPDRVPTQQSDDPVSHAEGRRDGVHPQGVGDGGRRSHFDVPPPHNNARAPAAGPSTDRGNVDGDRWLPVP